MSANDITASYISDEKFNKDLYFVKDKLVEMSLIDVLKSYKCFIAGGYGRCIANILRTNSPHSAKIHEEYFNYNTYGRGGDIDIFFETHEDYTKVAKYLTQLCGKNKNKYWYISKSPFAETFRHGSDMSNMSSARNKLTNVQLINCTFDTPENIIRNFDLINSMAGLTFRHDGIKLFKHKDFDECEIKSEISLNPEVPINFTIGKRLVKYRQIKNLKNLSENSKTRLTCFIEKFAASLSSSELDELCYNPTKDPTYNLTDAVNKLPKDCNKNMKLKENILAELLSGIPHDIRVIAISYLLTNNHRNETEDYNYIAKNNEILRTLLCD